MARIVALMVVAVLAAVPAAAIAVAPPEPQSSPFQEAPSQNQVGEQPAPAPVPVQQTEVDDGSVSARDTLLIGVGVVVLIGGIWFAISRDAKRVTAGHVPTADGAPRGNPTRASRRSRKPSASERKRRKRGRAR